MFISFVIVILIVLLPLWKLSPAGAADRQFIPLHYNVYFGTDQFGIWYQVFILPAIGASLLIINTMFQAVFYHREHVLSYFFALTTLLAELALFASMVFIILLNL